MSFFSEHNVDLSHHSSLRISPPRVNDKALVDSFTQEHDLTTAVKISINKVRGRLEVFTLADIVTGDGIKIRPYFASGLKVTPKVIRICMSNIPRP